MAERNWDEIRRLGREAKIKSQAEGSAWFAVAICATFICVPVAWHFGGEAAGAAAILIAMFVVLVVGAAVFINIERNFAERDRLLYRKTDEPRADGFDMTELYRRYPALPGAERALGGRDESAS